jgi:large subunit ribosomal protein L2
MKRIKQLTINKSKITGRNNQGRITVHHRGGGNKRIYRIIDFKRALFGIPAVVRKIEYDPNRTANIALINYKNGLLSYILAPSKLEEGMIINAGPNSKIEDGNTLPLENLPIGTLIHNIEMKPGHGGQLMRAAGTYAKVIKKDTENGTVAIRLCTGKLFELSNKVLATVGIVSNENNKNKKLLKAGNNR